MIDRYRAESGLEAEQREQAQAKAKASKYGLLQVSKRRYRIISRATDRMSGRGTPPVWYCSWEWASPLLPWDEAIERVIELRKEEDAR